jgi:hypothetical protein
MNDKGHKMTETQSFFDLTVSAPVRLARMRKAFADHPKKYPICPEHAKHAQQLQPEDTRGVK